MRRVDEIVEAWIGRLEVDPAFDQIAFNRLKNQIVGGFDIISKVIALGDFEKRFQLDFVPQFNLQIAHCADSLLFEIAGNVQKWKRIFVAKLQRLVSETGI